ncbi:MAG: hypothetical protein ACOYL6_15205 [Bacteriovoracaceae bacterium]
MSSSDNQNNLNNKIIVIDADRTPDISRIGTKELDYLEEVMDKLHQHQYRHVETVHWKEIFPWIILFIVFTLAQITWIQGLDLLAAMPLAFSTFILNSFLIGLVVIFSKCFTSLFNFKITVLRSLKVLLFIQIAYELMPVMSIFGKWIENSEGWSNLLLWCACPVVFYFLIRIYIPYRWLKISTITYFIVCYGLLFTSLSIANFRHFMMKDNEIMVYSDLGASSKKDVSEVKNMIDKITE